MKTASLFKNGRNQAVRLPKDFEFEGVSEVEITREGRGYSQASPKDLDQLAEADIADADFLVERPDVIEEGRVVL